LLTREGTTLSQIFLQFHYSPTTLYNSSTKTTFNTISAIYHHISQKECSVYASENIDQGQQLKKLSRLVNEMKSKLETLKLASIPCNEIQELELQTEEKIMFLVSMQDKNSITRDNKELLQAMVNAIPSH
jgi:hypothetical protein